MQFYFIIIVQLVFNVICFVNLLYGSTNLPKISTTVVYFKIYHLKKTTVAVETLYLLYFLRYLIKCVF